VNVTGLRFAANLSIIYGHLPLLKRPAAAAADGFTAVETWWPFTGPVPPGKETDAFATALGDAGVCLVAMNLPEGDMRAGDRGLLSSPRRAAEFRAGIDTAAGFAARTGCRVLNALYGNREPGTSPDRQDEIAIESLVLASRAADMIGICIALEAISPQEAPAYPLHDAATTTAVADTVNAAAGLGNTGILLDAYHHGRSGEDVPALLRRHIRRVMHVQVADAPGRGRPGSGTLGYPAIFAALRELGYDRWIGLEYEPVRDPAIDFDWLAAPHPGSLTRQEKPQ
jgi:hydroxypyruvate isomerase